ncbi:MAG TPA: UDP-N-acetylmuramoyl-L-alanine--D-glutamate ligase [Actinomycetota bacterium]|nr:UDP-N-acetylmuramoyl-L-alanine--D-glutamate ligase [Actinomycetota bacterium]
MTRAFEGERAVVIGLGVAGAAAARVLADEGADVVVSEARDHVDTSADLRGIRVRLGGHDRRHLEDATLVVASPGVTPDAPVLRWARELGLPVWGELELGARLAAAPYVSVTGTNGKTTTTEMIAACLRADGLDAIACGNIGHPFPVAARGPHDVLVVECSSFQLRMQESFHPRVSVLLNVAPDHLDWHGSFEEYAAAKARVFANQRDGDVHVGNRDDATGAAISGSAHCDISWFTLGEPEVGGTGYVNGELIGRWDADEWLGRPAFDLPALRADAAACAAACHAFGARADSIRRGLTGFEPGRHRGEVVVTIDGVRFVDNSKATNPHATLAAVGDASGVVLIAGGDAKGVDLSPIGALAGRLAGVVAIGASADEVVSLFEERIPTRRAETIEEAVAMAYELAPSPGTVLLAPACASWDLFRDYRERGDRFAVAARDLAGVSA